eukprot:jgi/Orpsp1_1/1182634/evm.model.c7180000082049.1
MINQTPSQLVNKTPNQNINQVSSPNVNKTQNQTENQTPNIRESPNTINSNTTAQKEPVSLVPVKKEITNTPKKNRTSNDHSQVSSSPETVKSLKTKENEDLAKKFEGNEFAERVVKIRIKLQKTMKRDLNVINKYIYFINIQRLEKLLNFLLIKKNFPPSDKYNIKNRCLALYNRWKELINSHEKSSQPSINQVTATPSNKSDIVASHTTSSPNPSHYSESHYSRSGSRSYVHSHQHSSHHHFSSRHHSSRYNPYKISSHSNSNYNSNSNSSRNHSRHNYNNDTSRVVNTTTTTNANNDSQNSQYDPPKRSGELDNDNYNIINKRYYGNMSPNNSNYSNNGSFYFSPPRPTYNNNGSPMNRNFNTT